MYHEPHTWTRRIERGTIANHEHCINLETKLNKLWKELGKYESMTSELQRQVESLKRDMIRDP